MKSLWCDNASTLEMCRECSTFSIVLYSKIKILSTPAIIQSFIQFGEMKRTPSSWQQEDLKNILKSCISNYTTAPNGLVAMAISYLVTSTLKKNQTEKTKRNWVKNEQCNMWMDGWMDGWAGSGAEPVSCSGGLWRRSARNHEGKKGQKCHQSNIQYLYLPGSLTGGQTNPHQTVWPHPPKIAAFVTYLTLPSCFHLFFLFLNINP